MNHITRREFIKLTSGGALAAGAGALVSGCSKKKSPVELDEDPVQINATVAAIKGSNLYTMTREAIEAVGGMASIVNPGEVVFIKPNFVTFPWAATNDCFNRGECTKLDILVATAEACLEAGASEVIIGDGSQLIEYSWHDSFTFNGTGNLLDAVNRFNAQYDGNLILSCLEVDYPGTYRIPSRTHHEELLISNIYEKADRIITVPVAKTHFCADLTLGLKNFIGVLSIAQYGEWLNGSFWNRSYIDHTYTTLCQVFLDVVAAKKPDLSIIDFSIGVDDNGPTLGSGGRTKDMRDELGTWFVLASKDVMAADATAARAMMHHVNDMAQLTQGYEMGLGEIREKSIELIGERLSDIQTDWQPAVVNRNLQKSTPGCPMFPSRDTKSIIE